METNTVKTKKETKVLSRTLGFKEFRSGILMCNFGNSGNWYFGCNLDKFYAQYLPKYPERTAGDLLVSYCFVDGKSKLYGNLQGFIPTIKEFENFGDLIRELKESVK